MKNLKNKVFRRKNDNNESSQRITNDTVAEHRERIIKEGKRFKYPHQYVKHRLIINTVILGFVVLIAAIGLGYWQLYKVQNTSELAYSLTSVIPVPVATVDGRSVRYSDYLLRYRSQEYSSERINVIEGGSADKERHLEFLRRESLNGLEKDMYAAKLAEERSISVSNEEVQQVINSDLEQYGGSLSREAYDAINERSLGLDRSEYERLTHQALLRQEVAFAVDARATNIKTQIAKEIKQEQNLQKIAQKYKGDVIYAAPGEVRLNNLDGGATQAAAKLRVGDISDVFRSTSGDGYYVVRLLEKTDTHLQYEYLQIELTRFDGMYQTMKDNGGIKEYIEIAQTQIEVQE